MIKDQELGVEIAETTDEAYWTETKQKAENAIKIEQRNIKINEAILELAAQQLKKEN